MALGTNEALNAVLNQEITVLASGARTTTQTSSDYTNQDARALIVTLDVTSAGTGSITVTIQGKDAVSGKYFTLLAGAAVTTVTTNRYKVSPDLAAVANVTAQDHVTPTFRILVTHNNANTITYSVGAQLVQ